MRTQKARTIYTVTLFLADLVLAAVAFVLAYETRVSIAWPEPLETIVPLGRYGGLMAVQVLSILATFFLSGHYYIPRAVSRIDQLYRVVSGATLGTMIAVAITAFVFKNDTVVMNYPRGMIVYTWLYTIILLTLGRGVHYLVRTSLRQRGFGTDRALLVGTNDTARIILQRILWSPSLGYDLVGVIADDADTAVREMLGVPVLGVPEDLPRLIDEQDIAEVLIVMPERGHREMIRVISYCERGRVSIKVFPDVFQYVTSEATIDYLGGLPLLTVRDFALRGYLLIFKRLLDLFGATLGLIFLSPLMLLVAVAIKLESPGPAFFIQERMGLDRRPFLMIKFRSMRRDAEKHGPGWTTANDPRQTRLGTFLRRVEIDELPNLINVFLGEMSLVGPRPEQAHYVEQFRRIVPRYMERHKEKGGMTGWAQVNGLRGDTSITERTKYDLWYSENWSILLDIKIILRTVWQIFERRSQPQASTRSETSSPALEAVGETAVSDEVSQSFPND
ncbi:MAG: undecaprenyl-phosphate glucose phosphotransferase [Anaerolineales bacterium]|nr:undecaprenyl-phosphate glucose phosphotransferase [Anaerolineales bacterium]